MRFTNPLRIDIGIGYFVCTEFFSCWVSTTVIFYSTLCDGWMIVWFFSTPLNWRMTTSLKWKSVVWCVNSIRKYFVVLYGRSCSGVFGNSICSRRRGENTSLIYVMQQAAINLSLYAHKFERQRCFKILGCISMIPLAIDSLNTGAPSDKSKSFRFTQKVFGVRLDSKKYLRFLLSETVLHCVVEISGLSGVDIP